ncbi:MAG: TonB-dependent receptor [Caulobacterales bacterium]|nr:TonB-dependent receptor [Caulobacterales bacterium]
MTRTTALTLAAALAAAAPAFAQDQGPAAPDAVLITGTRLAQTPAETGTSVSVITASDIAALGFDFAIDALAAAPGVTISQNGAFGGQASLRIRGAGGEQTLVLIDGVPVNDASAPGGGFDFARLDTENIDRIEVLKGPQSTLWGTDAIGGVVAITTKRATEGLGGGAFLEAGSFATVRGGAALEAGGAAGDIRLAAAGVTSDGISKADAANGNTEEDGFDSLTLSARGGAELPAGARLDAAVLWTDAQTAFDGFSFDAEGSVADADEVSETEELSAHLALTAPLFADRLKTLLLVGYSDIDRENVTDGVSSFAAEGERALYRAQGEWTIDARNTLLVGAERDDSSAGDGDTAIDSLFALYELKPHRTLTLTGGARRDDHERFGAETTGRVAAAFNPTEALTLRASWGQGFKAPTIFQTTFFCCGAAGPNADLQSESSSAFDIGVELRAPGGRGVVGATYFDQDTDNLITFSFLAGGYENIAEARSRGVEVFARYELTDWLSVSADYAWIDAEDGGGERLIRVPVHSGDVTATLDPAGPISGAILVRHNGAEEDLAGQVDAWTRVDLTGRYALSERLELFARVENLFDADYQQILGYGTPGVSGSAGVRVRY